MLNGQEIGLVKNLIKKQKQEVIINSSDWEIITEGKYIDLYKVNITHKSISNNSIIEVYDNNREKMIIGTSILGNEIIELVSDVPISGVVIIL